MTDEKQQQATEADPNSQPVNTWTQLWEIHTKLVQLFQSYLDNTKQEDIDPAMLRVIRGFLYDNRITLEHAGQHPASTYSQELANMSAASFPFSSGNG